MQRRDEAFPDRRPRALQVVPNDRTWPLSPSRCGRVHASIRKPVPLVV